MDVVFIIDVSSSMSSIIGNIGTVVSDFSSGLVGDHRFGLVVFGETCPNSPITCGRPRVVTNLTTIDQFLAAVAGLSANGSVEPDLDALYSVIVPDVTTMAWRDTATPAVILMGDEDPQTFSNITLDQVAPYVLECQLPGCDSATNRDWIDGDPLLLFVFASTTYIPFWMQLTPTVFNIITAESSELDNGIYTVFQTICIE